MSDSEPVTPKTLNVVKCLGTILLFAGWPLLNFANQNREQLDSVGTGLLISYFTVTTLASWLAFFVLNRLTGRSRSVAACATVCLFLVLFFSYHLIYDGLVAGFAFLGLSRGENPAYLVIVLVLCLACLFLVHQERVLELLLIFGAIVNVIPGLQFITFSLSATPGTPMEATSTTSLPPIRDKLNIFHFIADSYPRHDTLSRFVDLDNTDFISSLEERGFYVARTAYSNYPSTFLSISSTLSMRYLVTDETPRFETREVFYSILGGANPVVDHLLHHDYRYIHQGSDVWDGSRCGDRVEHCLSTGRAFQAALVDLTPLRRFLKRQRPSAVGDVGTHFEEIFDGRRPVYLFSHTMPPHPPRTFDRRCSELHVKDRQAPLRDYWGDLDGYRTDLKCVNRQLLDVVDALIERDPEAIILLHGDHGPAFGVDWSLPTDQWSAEQFEERFSILMALRLPRRCGHLLYPTISPVNLYPVVFGCLARVDPVLQPDVSYVSPPEKHPEYRTAYRYRTTELEQIP